MKIKKRRRTIKKSFIIFFLFFFVSCNKEIKNNERKVESILLNQVSILGSDYGLIVRPQASIKRTSLRNQDYSLFTYKIEKNENIDSVFVYDDGKIIFENKTLTLIDTKKVKINNKEIIVKKLFVPKDKFVGTDGDGSAIIYIGDEGLIASYGLYFHIIFFYDPKRYSEFQKAILKNSYNFKRHKIELNGKP